MAVDVDHFCSLWSPNKSRD